MKIKRSGHAPYDEQKRQRVLVTGSAGFIGSHLIKALSVPYMNIEVVEYDIKTGMFDDIRRTADIEEVIDTCDFVIHLAANADVRRSIAYPDEYWENNVEPTTVIQNRCEWNDIPLLYASSSCIHQWHKSPYGISKKVNEQTARPNQVGLRFTTVYGEGARDSMFMSKLMGNRLRYATNHIRDFIHVNDAVKAIMVIKRHLESTFRFNSYLINPAYDIGTGKGLVVSDLAKIINPGIEIREGHECEADDNTADISEIMELGWKPEEPDAAIFTDEWNKK
jgi:nucleoside-diphosphate-sugar epimerase